MTKPFIPIPTCAHVAVLLVVLGVAFRLDHLLDNRPLWLDEAYLAVNIVTRSTEELLTPLEYFQTAPIGYLLTLKTLVKQYGEGECVLRMYSFVASVLSLVLLYRLLTRVMSRFAACVGLAVLSVSPASIYYAAEVKQYAGDLTIALLLYLLALPLLKSDDARLRCLCLCGVSAPWFSHASSFVLAGIGLTLALKYTCSRNWTRLCHTGLMSASWCVSFAACVAGEFANAGTLSHMQESWQQAFVPMPPMSWGDCKSLLSLVPLFLQHPVGVDWKLGMLLSALGGALLWRDKLTFCLLVLPCLISASVSAMQLYPMTGRFLMFLLPTGLAFVAAGTEVLRTKWPAALWMCAVALIIGKPLLTSSVEAASKTTYNRHDVRKLLSQIREDLNAGQKAYVLFHARAQVAYCARQLEVSTDAVVFESRDPLTSRQQLDSLRGSGLVWVIYADVLLPQVEARLADLDAVGQRVESVRTAGAGGYLYRFE